MLVSSKGLTRTTIQHNNDQRNINEMNWEAKFDGSVANVSLSVNNNGKKTHNEFKLTNDNLADILSVPSINASLDQRLLKDFQLIKPKNTTNKNKDFYKIRYPISVIRKKGTRRNKIRRKKNKY